MVCERGALDITLKGNKDKQNWNKGDLMGIVKQILHFHIREILFFIKIEIKGNLWNFKFKSKILNKEFVIVNNFLCSEF